MSVLLLDRLLKNGLKHGRDAAMIPTLSSTLSSIKMSPVDEIFELVVNLRTGRGGR